MKIVWRRSLRCESGACVEVAFVGTQVWVRDSKNAGGPVLRFTQEEWHAFAGGVKNDEFNL